MLLCYKLKIEPWPVRKSYTEGVVCVVALIIYKIQTGNAGDMETTEVALRGGPHKGQMFSAYDNDADSSSLNCAGLLFMPPKSSVQEYRMWQLVSFLSSVLRMWVTALV